MWTRKTSSCVGKISQVSKRSCGICKGNKETRVDAGRHAIIVIA